ncbi:MAG: protein kinase [Acidobacteriota bacterium]
MIAPIGTGGMAVVYQAEHPTTHETVALKTVRVPHESQLGSIRREIHALARLSHPNIVRIVDHGIERGLPWYAMEVIRGVSLRQYVDERNARVLDRPEAAPVSDTAKLAQPLHITGMRSKDPDERPRRRIPRPGTHSLDVATLRGFLTMARRLCAPLAYLHGEGIVHGDLKPDNVIVRNTGHPVIVDFGLTVEISRETIEIAGQVIGSAAYMSPEQCKGSPLDARSDLYALGCILYELLTGRPPFLGQNVAEVLSKHLETEAMLPSEMAGGIPAALDALVMNLLTKDPRERAGYAVDVASMLVGLGAEDSVSTKMPKPRDYLYRPGLAGREEALLTFRQRLTRLTKGFGDLMLVGGESGSGKTRLSLAVAAEANRRELQVFAGECLPLPSASGSTGTSSTLLQGLGKPLRTIADRCRERGPAETKNILGARARVLALFEPSLAALPGLEDEPEPEELPPAAAQTRLFVALVDTFKAIAKGRPVIIMIDDIQWADDLTLGFLEYLVREEILLRGPLMITAAYRKEEVEGRLSRILAMSGLSHMELGKLDRTSIGQIVSDMLALPSPPDDLVAFMTERSEGNPLFVAEYLRTAVDEGLLNRNVAGGWEIAEEAGAGNFALRYAELGLPKTLQGVLARRLDALHEQARALADVASVLGRNIEGSILGAVAGVGQMDVHRNLGELVSRQILADVGNDQLRFVHDSIREVLYQRLSEERQRSLHRSVAEAMSTFYRAQRDERLAEMGHHWQHSGEPVRAQQCYLPAARRAASRYALHAAAKLYRAYLALSTRAVAPERHRAPRARRGAHRARRDQGSHGGAPPRDRGVARDREPRSRGQERAPPRAPLPHHGTAGGGDAPLRAGAHDPPRDRRSRQRRSRAPEPRDGLPRPRAARRRVEPLDAGAAHPPRGGRRLGGRNGTGRPRHHGVRPGPARSGQEPLRGGALDPPEPERQEDGRRDARQPGRHHLRDGRPREGAGADRRGARHPPGRRRSQERGQHAREPRRDPRTGRPHGRRAPPVRDGARDPRPHRQPARRRHRHQQHRRHRHRFAREGRRPALSGGAQGRP